MSEMVETERRKRGKNENKVFLMIEINAAEGGFCCCVWLSNNDDLD